VIARRSLIVCSSLVPMAHNLLGLLVVNFRERVVRSTLRVRQFIELCLQRLRITVLGALDEQSHEPNRQRAIPIEGGPVKKQPEQRISEDDAIGQRVRGLFAKPGHRMPECIPSLRHRFSPSV
jgi:hypothetical protein